MTDRELLPMKRVLERSDGGAWGEEAFGFDDSIVLRSTEQTASGTWNLREPATRHLSPEERRRTVLESGDLLVTKSSGSAQHIGKTTLVTDEVAALKPGFSNFMQRLRVRRDHEPRFYWYCLGSKLVRDQVDDLSTTTTGLANLTAFTIGGLLVPVAAREHQIAIADYLDARTVKTDALIGKQEQLIETLAERRQAVITHAVTKGLDPEAPTSDSGIAWVGVVPLAWPASKIKHGYQVTLGKMLDAGRSEREGDVELPYIRAANIQASGLRLDDVNEMAFSRLETVALSLKRDDLLVVEGGAVGVRVLLTEDMPGWAFQKTVNRVRSRGECLTAFLGYYIDMLRSGGVIDMLCNKSTIAHFTAEKLNEVEIALPPVDEQGEIVSYLDRETAQIDALSAKAREMITVLKERRQALISAAVTGKIDVRGLA